MHGTEHHHDRERCTRHAGTVVFGLLAAALAACGGGGSTGSPASGPPPPPDGSSTVTVPTTINLYPSQSQADSNRLFVFVTRVGNTAVNMPLAFDTGSAGLTLYAPDIFPADLVDASGFKFAAGETTLSYSGITVTSLNAQRRFGSAANGRTQVGNLGFAMVSFGDAAGQLTTVTLPVFFYYEVLSNATGQPAPVPPQRGWFGVNDGASLLNAGTPMPAEGYPACAPSSTGSCYVASVLKYLHYGAGVHAGFRLEPAPLASCTISGAPACTPAPMLTVGVDPSASGSFSLFDESCPAAGYSGPPAIGGYTVCQAAVAGGTLSVGGTSPSTLSNVLLLFDSGTPYVVINVPPGAGFPAQVPQGTSVSVTTPSGFDWVFEAGTSYAAGAPVQPTSINVNANAPGPIILGVGYFVSRAFITDFTTHAQGWE